MAPESSRQPGSDPRVAIVTGASRGLGAAFARMLIGEGYSLALGARDAAGLERLASDLAGTRPSDAVAPTILTHPLDMTQPESVAAFAAAVRARFGRADLLVNNAGVGVFRRLDEIAAAEFEEMLRVNVLGAWAATVAFLPALKASRGIVAMISSDASTRVFPTGGAYAASKFALRAL
jgi:NADP-dependent 3-hydroxy acid dehydrogenase YdfG